MDDPLIPMADGCRVPEVTLQEAKDFALLKTRLLDRLAHLDDQGVRDSCEADDAEDALAILSSHDARGFPVMIPIPSSNALRALRCVLDPPIPSSGLIDPEDPTPR